MKEARKRITLVLSVINKFLWRKRDMKFNGKSITELLAMNRRNFIKLFVGGAVGTGLSPLPWKLTDDIAIWTQNWPWVPVPMTGEFYHVKSICKLCPGGCGVEVRKVDGRAVKIEGRTDFPVNPGGICPLGMGGLQLLYNEENRFTGPMKRVGPRGSGKFQNITWDEALGTLAGRISSLRNRGNAGEILGIDGNRAQTTMSLMVERFIKAVGSPNYMRIPSSEDTARMVDSLMQGNEGSTGYDLENSDFILSFGSGLLEGWGSPGRVLNAWSLWRSEASKGRVRVVQVESRASNSASKADQWLPVKPGTETALALGIAHVIIKEDLYDKVFVENSTFGFSDWDSSDGKSHKGFREMVLEKYSPEQVSGITGTDINDIVSLARDFAGAKAPIALCGKGKGYLNGSLYEFMSVRALNSLVGNINRLGGLSVHDPIQLALLPDIELDAIAEDSLKIKRLDRGNEGEIYPFTHSLFNNLTKAILSGTESPVDTLLVFSANPSFTLPDGGDFRRALEKIPLIVSFSPYRDETAYMADLILPDHNYLEKTDDVVCPPGLQYPLYGLTQPVVDPIYDTKNSGDVIIQLAKMVGGSVGNSFPWQDYEEVLKLRVRGLFDSSIGLTTYDKSRPAWEGMQDVSDLKPDYNSFDEMWDRVKSGGLWYRPVSGIKAQNQLFKTPSGKFEFYSSRLESVLNGLGVEGMGEVIGISVNTDEAFLPHYEPLHFKTEEHSFPLKMVPYEIINLASDWLPSPPYLMKTLFANQLLDEDSFIEINPDTAMEFDLKEGDYVYIESSKGKVQVRVNIFEGAMPGIVYMPLGLGHRAYDDFLYGKGVNPNEIICGGSDPLSGQFIWWDTPVRLTKV
jgi:anaerobic selenocysteine-containing dehydrogenase